MTKNTIPVTRRAVVQRVNRALAKQNRKLIANKRWPRTTVRYHVISYEGRQPSLDYELVDDGHVDELDSEARELGVLAEYEELEDE